MWIISQWSYFLKSQKSNSVYLPRLLGPNFLSLAIKGDLQEFPGSPVVKTPCLHCKGHKFDLHMPCSVAKRKKGVFLPPDVEGAPFIWGIYFLFQEDRKER